MIVYRFDKDGFYIEPVTLKEDQEIPANCTDIPLPTVNYKPKFKDAVWVETLSDEEIEVLKNTPLPLSPIEELKKQQADLIFELMMNGVI
jgi:hypothetical protein